MFVGRCYIRRAVLARFVFVIGEEQGWAGNRALGCVLAMGSTS